METNKPKNLTTDPLDFLKKGFKEQAEETNINNSNNIENTDISEKKKRGRPTKTKTTKPYAFSLYESEFELIMDMIDELVEAGIRRPMPSKTEIVRFGLHLIKTANKDDRAKLFKDFKSK